MDPHDHPDIDLIAYVNGTLGGPGAVPVQRHLSGCPRCREEVEFLRRVRAAVRDMPAPAPDAESLTRLLRERPAPPARRHGRPGAGLGLALAASLLLVLFQGVLIVHLWTSQPAVAPLGGPEPAGAVLEVRFAPTATEAQIRRALRDVDGEFVSGPGAAGVYRVRLLGVAPGDRAARRRAARQLRSEHGVVREVSDD
ncbi:MAG TPA: hypothetical protein ENH08_03740 [Chromatiales bacterium]|nr:hypothetical protein [Chromatiales bacterium]